MTTPEGQPPEDPGHKMAPPPWEPTPPRRNWIRRHPWRTAIIGSAAALVAAVAAVAATSPAANGGAPASSPARSVDSATPAASAVFDSEFVTDARGEFNVGAEVTDAQLVQVGHAVCDGVRAGLDRKALGLIPDANGLGVTGGGADHLVNLAHRDLCGGDVIKTSVHTLLRASGSGKWSSPRFTVVGDSPALVVTYTYTGNGDSFGPDNFAIDLASATDDVLIANDIAFSGHKHTRAYPDASYGSHRYHVEIDAAGSWTITVRERY